jgi:hypothetical protein
VENAATERVDRREFSSGFNGVENMKAFMLNLLNIFYF